MSREKARGERPKPAGDIGGRRSAVSGQTLLILLTLLIAFWLRVHDLTSLPPGLHYDEAANGILAGDIAFRGSRPIFIPSYTGKETLFFYWAAVIMRGVGESVFSLRLASAFAGLLTVAGVVSFGRNLAPKHKTLGLFSAILIATSFPHLLFSRLGFRAIMQPLLQLLTVNGLWIGYRFGRKRDYILGGIFLGLTAYTYLAARLFPILLLFLLVPILIGTRRRRVHRAKGIGVFLGVATIVLAPLLWYFWQNPDAFWVRIGQVATNGASTGTAAYWGSYTRTLAMLFANGDPYFRFNIPHQPLLTWWMAALWLIGTIAWLLTKKSSRAILPLLIATPLIMILPSALALGEIIPSNLRAIGVYPFLIIPIAYALTFTLSLIQKNLRQSAQSASSAFYLIPTTLLLTLTLTTQNQYFTQWGSQTTNFYESDSDLIAIADYLNEQPTNDQHYVAALHYRHPTLAFTTDQYDTIKWLPESQALVLPQGKAQLIYPHNSPAPQWAAAILPAATTQPIGPDGQPLYTVYELDNHKPPAPTHPTQHNFGGLISLTGYDLIETTSDGLTVLLHWQANAPSDQNYMPFVHVEDAFGHRWGQRESFAYPSEQWAASETIIQEVNVPLNAGLPQGNYRVLVGLFSGDQRLPLLDDGGRYAGSAAVIESVQLTVGSNQLAPTVANPLNAKVVNGLELLGFADGAEQVETSTPYPITLYWTATTPPPENYTNHLDLIAADGSVTPWYTRQPNHDQYPFAEWKTPSYVTDILQSTIPSDLPSGSYQIRYSLRISNGGSNGGSNGSVALYEAIIRTIEVQATERLFEPPSIATHTENVTFGDEITLYGYSLTPNNDGTAALDLLWQAAKAPTQNYTVFVHLLNPDGTCCAWQQDVMPQQNGYPTNRWAEGEFVVDSYTIVGDISLALEIGLYIAETGQRLSVQSNQQNADFYLLGDAKSP